MLDKRPIFQEEFEPKIKDMIELCWNKDPKYRPNAFNLLEDLKRASTPLGTTNKEKQFFEVDFARLKMCVGESNIIKQTSPPHPPLKGLVAPKAIYIVKLQRPQKSPILSGKYSDSLFERVELQFRRFFDLTKQKLIVDEVHVVFNDALISQFQEAEQQMQMYSEGINEFYNTSVSPLGQSYLTYLRETANTESIAKSNPLLAWHGVKQEHLDSICWYGLLNLSTTDAGWYGKGIYLTQSPNYGQFYINNQKHKDTGSYELLLCWVILGKPFPVTSRMDGSPCESGYTSHYVVINSQCHPKEDRQPAYGDEIVVFKSSHVLPLFIVKYSLAYNKQ